MNTTELNTTVLPQYPCAYIDGAWRQSATKSERELISPASEKPVARIGQAGLAEVEAAVAAARRAFARWSQTAVEQRAALIRAAADAMQRRRDELADAISLSLGCPRHLTRALQVDGPIAALADFADKALAMNETKRVGNSLVMREAMGVCALINPWNYPLHQLIGKLGPALAAGCTVVIKPAEQTPLQDLIVADIFHQVGLPAGVLNLVLGPGSVIGPRLCAHPEVDMVSFTGSNAAGVRIAEAAAASVKRVTQELGGKSPYIILPEADLERAVTAGVRNVMQNSGQTCTALTRMLVQQDQYEAAVAIAKRVAESLRVGMDPSCDLGPMASRAQRDTVVRYIETGLREGARLVTGGPSMPEEHTCGFYVRPTIFADVRNDMVIAREEIFGPVLCLIPYRDTEQAIAIANDTPYGLSSAVYAKDLDSALPIARRIRAGQCFINEAEYNYEAPFGGFKQSGNGREFGWEGVHEFTELKAIQI